MNLRPTALVLFFLGPLLAQAARSQGPEPRGSASAEVRDRKREGTGRRNPGIEKALGGFRGRLLRGMDRSPLAGLEVEVLELRLPSLFVTLDRLLDEGSEAPRGTGFLRESRTRTAEDGRFSVGGLHPRGFFLLAIGSGTEWATCRIPDRSFGSGETADLGDLLLLERGGVRGRILGPDGKGVEGVRVLVADLPFFVTTRTPRLFGGEGRPFWFRGGGTRLHLGIPGWVRRIWEAMAFRTARTGPDGTFAIRDLRPGVSVLLALHPGFPPFRRSLRVRTGQEKDLGVLRLAAGTEFEARILGPDRKAFRPFRILEGPLIPFSPDDLGHLGLLYNRPFRFEPPDRFLFHGLRRLGVFVGISRERGMPLEIFGPFPFGRKAEIVLPPLRSGSLEVVDPSGRPPSGVRARILTRGFLYRLEGYEDPLDSSRHLRAAGPGRWRVEGLPPGSYTVLAGRRGGPWAEGTLVLPEREEEGACRLVLPSPRSFRLRVVDPSGRPLAGARLHALLKMEAPIPGRWDFLSRIPIFLGETDSRGDLEVRLPLRTAKVLTVEHPAFAIGRFEPPPVSGAFVKLRLPRLGRLVGRVETADLLRSRTSRFFALRWDRDPRTGPEFRFARADAGGEFRFEGLEPGTWRIHAIDGLDRIRSPFTRLLKLAEEAGLGGEGGPAVEVEIGPGDTTRIVWRDG